jgi:uncharacterized membrane protein YgcG
MSHQIPKECERFRELLPEQAEGRLVGRERVRVERHLAGCPRCSAEVEDLRAVISSVRAVPGEEVPEDLIPRVRRAVQEKVPARAPAAAHLPWARLAIPVAVLMAVVGITFALRAPKQQQLAAGSGIVGKRAGAPAVQPRQQAQPGPADNLQMASKPAEGVAAPAASAASARGDEREPSSAGIIPPVPNVSISGRLGGEGEAPAAEAEAPAAAKEETLKRGTSAPPLPYAMKGRGGAARGGGGAGGGRGGGGGGRGAGGRAGMPAQAPPQPAREQGAESRGVMADLSQKPLPPIGAVVTLAQSRDGKMLALKLSAETPVERISLSLGKAPPQSYRWQGPAAAPAWIPLTAEQLGPGPAQIPVRIEAGSLTRSYVLFLPVMSRLGESAALAPAVRYDARPLSAVLGELTALTGFIVLAESPLDAAVTGQVPLGTPGEALTWVAGEAGFEVHSESGLAYTLTHSR